MPTTSDYDVIVVGARCAGSATALLLARRGRRVLLVDRAHFPSDTVSTHLIHPPGVAALERWGLIDRLIATGCPAIDTYSFDFGPLTLSGTPSRRGTPQPAYCPRRIVLDQLLLDAAAEAGAEVREGFTVQAPIISDNRVVGVRGHTAAGTLISEHARIVVGADGEHSRMADAVGARTYQEQPAHSVAYLSYWSGMPVADASWAVRPGGGYGAFPTHDGLTMLLAAWPLEEFARVKRDVEGNYLRALEGVYGDRLACADREERIVGRATANHFRTPYGPGWVLVGDAGYVKDPVTAQGMTDAFLDAEVCANALDDVFAGRTPFGEALAEYQRRRDERVLPIFQFTTDLARLEPPPPEFQQVLGSIAGHPAAMDEFAAAFAGTMSLTEFLDPVHIAALAGAPNSSPATARPG